ncbi:hypothetical protein BX600DRAFT_500166 [Xylariales sp. PMI_506]|nr:hypothetical protein BX600DRAFT_500166 [Xylariales sp. PMI_506]
MSDAWFAEKLAPNGDPTDGCHPDEAAVLKTYLAGETTPTQAAVAITGPVTSSNDPSTDLPRLYTLLADALIELPSATTPQLIDLIRAIESLPPPSAEWYATLPESNRPAHGLLWRGLPGFGHLWADDYPSLRQWLEDGGLSKPDVAEREAFLIRCVRRAEVEARLAEGDLAGIPIDWGYECVADALERSQAVGVAEVPVACKWIKFAGERFRKGIEKGETSWALGRDRDLWRDKRMRDKMGTERWEFWIQRLKTLESDEKLPGVVKNIVRGCLGNIDDGSSA